MSLHESATVFYVFGISRTCTAEPGSNLRRRRKNGALEYAHSNSRGEHTKAVDRRVKLS